MVEMPALAETMCSMPLLATAASVKQHAQQWQIVTPGCLSSTAGAVRISIM